MTGALSSDPERATDLRVALFCANFEGVTDGASKTLHRLVDYLRKQGVSVRVYSAAAGSTKGVVRVPSFPIPTRPEYRVSLGLPRAVVEDVAAFDPSLVHISVPDRAGLQAQALARKWGVPVVASLHTRFETYLSYYGLGFLRPLVERRLRRFYSTCHAVLVPNQAIADELRANGWAREPHVWSRGVDHTLFNPGRRSKDWRSSQGFAQDDIVLLFFGRLVREKGLSVFLAVTEALQKRGVQTKVLVVGGGPERASFQQRLPGAVFTGHLAGPDLARAVASADILINPSTTEAFGNVNLEAMASGLAIVSADVPSARALIQDGVSGLLVNPDDPGAYASAVERISLVLSGRSVLGSAAAATSAAYDWDTLLASVLDLYLSMA